ncbi:hypothetical protein Tco_0753065 [Tanacetum coccineum]
MKVNTARAGFEGLVGRKRAKRGWDTEIPQSSGPPKKVGDESVYTGEDDRVVRAATTATSLEAEQESGNIHKTRSTATLNEPSPQGTGSEVNTSGSGEDSMEHQDDLTDFVPPTPHDSPLSGGHTPGSDGRPNINELMAIYTNFSNRVLALETSKTAQDLVIKKLKKKVKRLEKKQRERTPGMKLFKIGTSRRKSLDKENVSKQGRNLKTSAASASVTTAGVSISTAEPRTPPTTTTTAFEDEDLTIAQTLVKMRKGTSIVLREKQRIGRERATEQEAKDVALIEQMEDIQARMDADELLAERLQQEEREQFTIEEKSRMLVEMIAERKRSYMKRSRSGSMSLFLWILKWLKTVEKVKLKAVERKQLLGKEQVDDEAVKVEYINIKQKMLDDFDRQDMLDLYRLVKERLRLSRPEGYGQITLGMNLITFHVLLMDTRITIYMLIEKTYPLTQEMLSGMLSRRLEFDHECEMAYELLKFTRSQLQK